MENFYNIFEKGRIITIWFQSLKSSYEKCITLTFSFSVKVWTFKGKGPEKEGKEGELNEDKCFV